MGYFSNGTEGDLYFDQYCSRCIHVDGPDGQSGCAVWHAHLLANYQECNKKDSLLHLLIPRTDSGCNSQCLMFSEGKGATGSHNEWLRRQGLLDDNGTEKALEV